MCRKSMDLLTSVTPPRGVTFLRRNASKERSDSFYKGPETWKDDDSLLTKPLVSETMSFKEEEPTSKKQCSFAQSVINGINMICGVGILTIPYAVKEGGWLSLIILVVFSIVCCYTGILLKRCLENYPELKTFPDISQAAFGVSGRLCIAITLFMELYASCVEYITLMSDNLSSIFPNANVTFGGADIGTHQVFAITAAILVLPTVWIKNLSLLSYVSGFLYPLIILFYNWRIFTTILVTLCLFWVGIVDQVGYKPGAKIFDLANVSVAIGIYGFGFGGHAVFPSIYSSMKEPSQFQPVLYISFAFCLAMYTGVAAMGYLTFGDAVESQFTLNMPKELYASKVATWTTVRNQNFAGSKEEHKNVSDSNST
ncbi:putative amino acid transporter, transmembrane domain-containing protein [Lupinus albus]|uniref:Putative amino acid transporter, transmembrane domain-containing protein n=1 Tax=Lupinus albus TaxID=3870 RepID=A0A6A4RAS4_LUPAL|nr:putative amino acid transporter, transmembrane domain-containing protein [Lupinus albus]